MIFITEKSSGFNLLQAASYAGDYDLVLELQCAYLDTDWMKEFHLESTLNDAKVSPGKTAYEIASSHPSDKRKRLVNLFDEFEEKFASLSDLHKCASKCDAEAVVELVLENDHLVDTPAIGNRTPLLWASSTSSSDVIRALVDLGANVNALRDDNCTPLSQAVNWNNYMVVKVLLENNANVNYTTSNDHTALHMSVKERNEQITKLLLDNEADPNTRTRQTLGDRLFLVRGKDKGKAAWHYVLVDKSKLSLFHKKVDGDSLDVADFGAVIKSGWGKDPPKEVKEKVDNQYIATFTETPDKTPLHLATERNLLSTIDLLVSYGADINARDADGYTPLHTAACHGKLEAVKKLVELNADLSLLTNDGLDALQLANLNDEEEMEVYLKSNSTSERLR